jgi:RNA polymerase-binding transcription factor DksA
MNQTEVEAFRERLHALLRKLGGTRKGLKEEALQGAGGETSGSLSDVPIHPADLGTHYFEEEGTLTLIENEEALIEEINRALGRIDQGTFGRCESCGGAIAEQRLQIIPYARQCIRCASKPRAGVRSQ